MDFIRRVVAMTGTFRSRVGKTVALVVPAVAALALLPPPSCLGAQVKDTHAVAADYHGTGVVVALMPPPSTLHATRPVIVIHHAPIPPLMPEEMDMPFIAASTALFEGLHPGDRITFALKDTSDALLVVAIERVRPSANH